MSDLLNPAHIAHLRHLFHRHSPLVHCMTNDVVQTFTANVLLAIGASPAMVIDPDEASQFAAIADALLINVGTLTVERAAAMRAAAHSAQQAGKPWTLDPVAVGALTLRTEFCRELLALQPAAVRGNASEIMALAGMSGGGRGVDTTDTAAAALPAAQAGPPAEYRCRGNRRGRLRDRWSAHARGHRRRSADDPGSRHRLRAIGGDCRRCGDARRSAGERGRGLRSDEACGGKAALQGGPGSFTPAFLDALYAGGDL